MAGDNMNISRTHAKIEYNFEKGVQSLSGILPPSAEVLAVETCCT